MAPLLVGAAFAGPPTAAGVTAGGTAGLFGAAGQFAAAQAAQTLLLAGVGVTAAGQIQAGRAGQAQAESQRNIAAYNAAVQEREAKARKTEAAFAQKRQARRGARIKSALTARIAAAGGLGAPVAADLAAEQAAELELEGLLIGYEAEVGAGRALSQAEIDRLSGRAAGRRGRAAITAGRIGAGGTLLTGFGATFR